jgi:hypothetical protein
MKDAKSTLSKLSRSDSLKQRHLKLKFYSRDGTREAGASKNVRPLIDHCPSLVMDLTKYVILGCLSAPTVYFGDTQIFMSKGRNLSRQGNKDIRGQFSGDTIWRSKDDSSPCGKQPVVQSYAYREALKDQAA